MKRIFVSYRRKDSEAETGRIVQALRTRFGQNAVFHDVTEIKGGQRFHDVIKFELENAAVVLVVIGNTWLEVDDRGHRRIDDPDDHHRFEIEFSLSKLKCTVIPVLVRNTELPKKEELPEQLAGIIELNAVKVRPDPDFSDDMENLAEHVADKLPQERSRATRNRVIKWSSAIGLVIVASFLMWWSTSPQPVRVTIKGWPGYAPIWIADKMKLCDGVDIAFVEVEDVDDAIKHVDHRGEKRSDMGYWLTDSHVIARLDGVQAVVVLKVDVSLEADAMIAFKNAAFVVQIEKLRHFFVQRHPSKSSYSVRLNSPLLGIEKRKLRIVK